MFLTKKVITIICLVLVLFSLKIRDIKAAPGINQKITFQGKVVNGGIGDSDGTNVPDGNYDFVFTAFDALSAGTSLWTETWDSGTTQVPLTSGIFVVQLGTYVTFPATIDFNTDNIFLAVNFNGDGDMSPRVQFTAVPYAFNAQKVAGLTVTNSTGTLTIPDGKTISFGDNFSTAGVGITLDQSLATTDSPTFTTLTLSSVSVGTGTTVIYIDSSGNLVQGTLPPSGAGTTYPPTNGLQYIGSAIGLGGTITQASFTNINLGSGSSGLSILGVNSNTQVLTITQGGNIGIGTTAPGAKIDINGGTIGLKFDTVTTSIDTAAGQGLTFQGRAASTFSTTSGDINLIPAGGAVVIGAGTSTFTFNPVSGPVYAGAARPSKVIRLSPEYAGATLSADGSSDIGGTMTADSVLNVGGSGWRNYYQWSSGNASLQDYSVIVRVALPSDFDTWETGSCPGSTCALEIQYQTGVGTSADNYVSAKITNDSDTPGSEVCSIGSTASTGWSSSGCTEAVLNDASAPEWDAAGEIAVIRLKMAAKSTASALARVGDIILRYKAKF